MLDPAFIRKNPDLVRAKLADRGDTSNLDWFVQRDREYRSVTTELQQVQARQKAVSKEYGAKKWKGEPRRRTR
jgi:seryl-tRNA synthetase